MRFVFLILVFLCANTAMAQVYPWQSSQTYAIGEPVQMAQPSSGPMAPLPAQPDRPYEPQYMAQPQQAAYAPPPTKPYKDGFRAYPYLGADYTFSSFQYDERRIGANLTTEDVLEKNFNGYSPYIGYRFHRNVAIEVGYGGFLSESKSASQGTTNYSSDAQYWSVYGDVVGIYPVSPQVNLLGSLGYEYITAKFESLEVRPGRTFDNETENGVSAVRFGLGAEWNATPEIAIRGMGRYVATDFNGVDGYFQGTLGMKYNFTNLF